MKRIIRDASGSGVIELVIAMIGVLVISFAGWYVWQSKVNANASLDAAAEVTTAIPKAAPTAKTLQEQLVSALEKKVGKDQCTTAYVIAQEPMVVNNWASATISCQGGEQAAYYFKKRSGIYVFVASTQASPWCTWVEHYVISRSIIPYCLGADGKAKSEAGAKVPPAETNGMFAATEGPIYKNIVP